MKILLLVFAYLIGSIQPAYLISRYLLKKDIRTLGSKNAGASNMTIHFGWKYGVITGLFDVLKATIPMMILHNQHTLGFIALFGGCVILGHNYPFYMQFKGGKGTASFIGMMFGLSLVAGSLSAIGLVIMTLGTGYITYGTLISYIIGLGYFGYQQEWVVFLVISLLFLMSLLKHLINMKRIMNGTEVSLYHMKDR